MATKLSSSELLSIEPAESPTDVQYAAGLVLKEEWHIAEYDFPIIKSLSPDRFYIAKLKGHNIGCLVILMVNPNHAYIHSFIIEEGYRGRGYGTRLFDVVLASLGPSCSVTLDSVENMVPYYEQRGFKQSWKGDLYKCSVVAVSHCLSNLEKMPHVHITASLRDISFDALAAYDGSVFGEPRSSALEKWIFESDGSSWVAVDKTGKIVGYTVCHTLLKVKAGGKSYRISPLFADNLLIAKHLLKAVVDYCLAKEEYADSDILRLRYPAANSEALKLCKELKGEFKDTHIKMYTEGTKEQDINRAYVYCPY